MTDEPQGTPDPTPVEPVPVKVNRRTSQAILRYVLLPLAIVIGVPFAATVSVMASLSGCQATQCDGGIILIFLIPVLMLLGVVTVPFIIWYSIARAQETHTAQRNDVTSFSENTPAFAEEGTPSDNSANSDVPVAVRDYGWRARPLSALLFLICWYTITTALVYASTYAYAWQEEANSGHNGFLSSLSIVVWAASPLWLIVLRWPRVTPARVGIAILATLLITPVLYGITASTAYDAGRNAWRENTGYQQPESLDNIIKQDDPSTWDDTAPNPNNQNTTASPEPTKPHVCPPAATPPKPPNPATENHSTPADGEQPIVHVSISGGVLTCENNPAAAANTGDLINLAGWNYNTPAAITPADGVGWSTLDANPGVSVSGNVFWRPCKPGLYTLVMGEDTGTVTVTGPDL